MSIDLMIKGEYSVPVMLSKNLVLRFGVMSFHDEKKKISIFSFTQLFIS